MMIMFVTVDDDDMEDNDDVDDDDSDIYIMVECIYRVSCMSRKKDPHLDC